jgi:hypothetical protein
MLATSMCCAWRNGRRKAQGAGEGEARRNCAGEERMIDAGLIEATTTELFEMAIKETSDKSSWDQAVDDIYRQVLERYPEMSVEWLFFSMGRALGRYEYQRREKR